MISRESLQDIAYLKWGMHELEYGRGYIVSMFTDFLDLWEMGNTAFHISFCANLDSLCEAALPAAGNEFNPSDHEASTDDHACSLQHAGAIHVSHWEKTNSKPMRSQIGHVEERSEGKDLLFGSDAFFSHILAGATSGFFRSMASVGVSSRTLTARINPLAWMVLNFEDISRDRLEILPEHALAFAMVRACWMVTRMTMSLLSLLASQLQWTHVMAIVARMNLSILSVRDDQTDANSAGIACAPWRALGLG